VPLAANAGAVPTRPRTNQHTNAENEEEKRIPL
jgi:hypothetical protein